MDMGELFGWPGGAQAAVSLTYDDGADSALDQALPDLEMAGFLGTFYLTTSNPWVMARKAEWKNAFLSGHEIGNHTLKHPCRGQGHEYNLEAYRPLDIRKEILAAATWLNHNIGVDNYRTFAYPCGHVAIGNPPDEGSYSSAVRACHFAARLAVPAGGINDPHLVAKDPLKINAAVLGSPNDKGVEQYIEYCEQAARSRGWAVLVFHCIGVNQARSIKRVVHQQLIEHLQDKRFWVAPVREVARYIIYSM